LGQALTVGIFSVAGGDDKVEQYAERVRHANLVLLTKTDLLTATPVDVEAFIQRVRRVNPSVPILAISSLRGEGMGAWCNWIRQQVLRRRPAGAEAPAGASISSARIAQPTARLAPASDKGRPRALTLAGDALKIDGCTWMHARARRARMHVFGGGTIAMTSMLQQEIVNPEGRGTAAAASGAAGQSPSIPIPNRHVRKWVEEMVALCQPDKIYLCNGSQQEAQELFERGVREGTLIKLNQEKWPGCYYHRSNPNDVARSEHLTFICTPGEDQAGPTNNWMNDKAAYAKLRPLFHGSMRGRTMYVVPFVMGPIGSPLAKVGVELTDSLYVAVSMGIMTRMGDVAWEQLGDADEFTHCLHSLLDVNPERRYICHFPQDNTIWSIGSGYGGNALLGKKCMALRIASWLGYQQGWMAEHMLLMGVTDPNGEKTYVAAAFPSACGKTNFAMLIPPRKYKSWKITTVGDDIVWMWVDPSTGRLRAINPESGYFGVVPGTNEETNPNAMRAMSRNAIFTNVALLPEGDVWWEGKTDDPPTECIDWTGEKWTPQIGKETGRRAAHPNSRFTAPMMNNPVLDEAANDPAGVPVGGIIFGGRRSKSVPLIFQAFNWVHGVYLGATIGSETTAAATGQVGIVRRDPMAMLPFIGYNIRDYLVHWFRMRKRMKDCPRIFHVNWFRKDENGKFLWPGFGENMRVLRWIIDRCHGRAYAVESPIGWVPQSKDIDLDGLKVTPEQFEQVQAINLEEVKAELLGQEELFLRIAGDMPKEMVFQRELLISRL
jgi:phosphoenolpyruvate carboxykinase (GTP)